VLTNQPSRTRWGFSLGILLLSLWNLSQHPVLWSVFGTLWVGLLIPRAVRPLKKIQFWVAILLLILVVPLVSSHPDRTFLIFRYDSIRFTPTLVMAARGVILFLLFQVASVRLTRDQITGILLRLGVKNLEEMLSIARETLPRARRIWMREWTRFRESRVTWWRVSPWLDFLSVVFTDLILFTREWSPGTDKAELSPNSLVQRGRTATHPLLVIVLGTEGSGKTAWIQHFIARSSAERIDGFFSPATATGPEVYAKNLVRIATGETRPLCSSVARQTELTAGKYFFEPATFSWANRELAGLPDDLEWIIVDEVGILEMEGKGFAPGLGALSLHPGHVVLTLRPQLRNRFMDTIAIRFLRKERKIHEIHLS